MDVGVHADQMVKHIILQAVSHTAEFTEAEAEAAVMQTIMVEDKVEKALFVLSGPVAPVNSPQPV